MLLYPFFTSSPALTAAVAAAHLNVDGSPSNAASTTHVILAPSMLNLIGVMITCPPVRSGLRSIRMSPPLVGSYGSVNPERYTRCSIKNSHGAALFLVNG